MTNETIGISTEREAYNAIIIGGNAAKDAIIVKNSIVLGVEAGAGMTEIVDTLIIKIGDKELISPCEEELLEKFRNFIKANLPN